MKAAGIDELDVTGNAIYTVATELKKEELVRCRKLGLAGWVWEWGQKFELSGAADDDDENGLDSELSAEVSRDDVDKSLNVRTSGGIESTQKFDSGEQGETSL